MPVAFDPANHAVLVALGERLQELSGDSAYRAGRDYLRKGMIQNATVAGTVARASVRGSTDYQISVTFTADVKVTCTCPAHRRNKHCKHVVAVCVALLEQPKSFQTIDPVEIPQVVPPPTRKRRDGAAKQRAEELKAEQRDAGLVLVDRLLEEVTAGGVAALGKEQLALLTNAAETVRALKLRRLGNRLMALRLLGEDGGDAGAEPERFAALLGDVSLVRQVLGANLAGKGEVEPGLAEELLGKTWRESELERVSGLELMPLAEDNQDEGEFRVESTYLIDLATGEMFVERLITPRGLRGERRAARRLRLLVDEAGVYPGISPRRLKLIRVRRAPLQATDVQRVLDHAIEGVADVGRRVVERLAVPVAAPDVAIVFRPAGLVALGDRIAATDGMGRALPLDWPAAWSKQALGILPEQAGGFALVGLAGLGARGPELTCLSIVGDLRWGNGPTYPDLS